MKRCPQCYQTFSDENMFCLSDGTTLMVIGDTSSSPTIITSAPFLPSQSAPQPAVRQGVNPIFVYLGIGLLVLLAGGAAFMWIKSADSSSKNDETIAKKEEDLKRREQELANAEKEKLQKENEELKEKNQKAEEEKLKLQKQKQPSTVPSQSQTQMPSSSAGTAFVPRPTTNVRVSPTSSSAILCKITEKITIRTFGSSGVRDNNGVWIYTDYCGTIGFIHSTQIK